MNDVPENQEQTQSGEQPPEWARQLMERTDSLAEENKKLREQLEQQRAQGAEPPEDENLPKTEREWAFLNAGLTQAHELRRRLPEDIEDETVVQQIQQLDRTVQTLRPKFETWRERNARIRAEREMEERRLRELSGELPEEDQRLVRAAFEGGAKVDEIDKGLLQMRRQLAERRGDDAARDAANGRAAQTSIEGGEARSGLPEQEGRERDPMRDMAEDAVAGLTGRRSSDQAIREGATSLEDIFG